MASQQTSSPPSPDASQTPITITPPSEPSTSPNQNPPPTSNTLIITNLSPTLFTPSSLADIRTILENLHPLYAFCPIKNLRRIIVVYYSIANAFASALYIATTPLQTVHSCRVYYGEPTPTEESPDRFLHAPKSQKMFFISPPPSPPHGWVSRDEGPPNREVWAEDLAKALEGVRALGREQAGSAAREQRDGESGNLNTAKRRRGSRSVVYDPQDHGDSLTLPAVMVEDTTMDPSEGGEDQDIIGDDRTKDGDNGVKIITHTSRPPVELIEGA